MKRHAICALAVIVLVGAFVWAFYNYNAAIMIARGDIREASYLASEFATFCVSNKRIPTEEEARGFSTRLLFEKLDGSVYIYRCGLFGQDALYIERDPNGRIQFTVHGGAFY